jgi:hypothetical protein
LEQINIGDPPPPRQKIFGQCTILGVKKNFPEKYLGNIAQFLSEYGTTTLIGTTNCGLFGFFISHFTNTYGFSFERTDNIFTNCIFVRISEIFKTNRETWRSARKPRDSQVNRETWQLCLPPSDVLIHLLLSETIFSPLPLRTAEISSVGGVWIFSGATQ